MNKLLAGVAAGVILFIVGAVMYSYGNYFSSVRYAHYTNCYNLYPSTYVNGTYVYPSAYYNCETNSSLTSARYQFYSSLVEIPGTVLVVVGGITLIISVALMLTAAYKDRKKPAK